MQLGAVQLSATRINRGGTAVKKPVTDDPDLSELGATGVVSAYSPITLREYNPRLRGRRGIKQWDEMKRSDAQVRATLRIVKAPLLSAQWYMQPYSDDEMDREISDFVSWNLFDRMQRTWFQFLWEALLHFDYGYYVFEKVWDIGFYKPSPRVRDSSRERPVVLLQKLASRHPLTIDGWKYDEETGDPLGAWHTPGGLRAKRKLLPMSKIIVFTMDEEGGDLEGTSILRSAYKHWYYKENLYKVDAIQKERHGIGVPVVKLPPGFKRADKILANEMVKNLRTNEKAHVVLPPGWELEFASINTNLSDALKSAEHHDLMIARNVLASFLNSDGGSQGQEKSQIDIFIKALRSVGDYIGGQINQQVIPQLVDYNYNADGYPKLRVRRIGENADWRALSVALRNMIEPGLITPDADTEAWLRDQMDFPLPSKEIMDRSIEERITKQRGDIVGDVKENDLPQPGTVEGNNSRDGQRSRGEGHRGGPTDG